MRPGNLQGLVYGKVTDVNDPENLGRVRVKFPWLDEEMNSRWASMVAPFAGDDRGIYFMPEVDDEVIVGFLQGDFNNPYILGAMWNGKAAAPSPDPRQRMIRSRNGHTIRFVDSTPASGDVGALIIEDGHGNRITLSNGLVSVRSTGVLLLEGQSIVLQCAGVMRTVTPMAQPI